LFLIITISFSLSLAFAPRITVSPTTAEFFAAVCGALVISTRALRKLFQIAAAWFKDTA
jgi:hypothetical protein